MASSEAAHGGAGEFVVLLPEDGEGIRVAVEAAKLSKTIAAKLEGGVPADPIRVPNVSAEVLCMVIRYCEKHRNDEAAAAAKADSPSDATSAASAGAPDALKKWNEEFLAVDNSTLVGLIIAAEDLNIEGLRELACKAVADQMTGKSPEQIRQIFGIKNDLKPEVEKVIKSRYKWVFEK